MKKRVISILTVLFLIAGLLWHENYATASQRITITYVMDGNTVVTQEVEIGSTASTPTVTAPDGYFISGYQLSDGSAVSADMVYTSDTTVYIQLEPYSQTVAQDAATPTPVEMLVLTDTPIPTIAETENTEDENTDTENGNDIAPAGINISVFFVPETFSSGLLPTLTDYTESVVVTANEQGTITMPVIVVPQGLNFTGYVDAEGNAVNGETVFLSDTAIYAQYALVPITDVPTATPTVIETPTESPLVTDVPEMVEEGQIPTEIVLEPELILHYVTIHYAGLVTRDGYTYYDYDDSYVYVCEVKENGTIDIPPLSSYAGMTYVGLMDDYGNFVSTDTVFTGEATLYAVYDYGYSLMSLSVDGEEVTESATLSHVHGGSSTTGGTCYEAVYHVHEDACYTTGKLTAYSHGSGGHADAAVNGCNANKTCRWISGGTCSVCGNVTYYFPCNQSKAAPKVGDVHCNKLTCTTSTTEVIGYNLNCAHTDCGTVTMASSNTQDNAPNTTLSINLASSGAGATITAYNWSTGATTDSILVANNGDYTCEVTYTDSVTGASSTVTVGMTVSNIDFVPPTVTVIADTDTATKGNVNLTVSATDNVGVASYSIDGVTYSSATTYEVTANGTYTLYAKDLAGNVGTAQYTVTNIDKVAPDVTVTFTDEPTNGAVTVTISATDLHSAGYDTAHGNNISYSFNGAAYGTKTQYSVAQNGTYIVSVCDVAGNVTEKSITVNGIDTKAPVISGVNSSDTAMTNQNITLTVLATDTQDSGYGKNTRLTYSMNGSAAQTSNQFTVTTNGTYNFAVTDPAGNKDTFSFAVSNIDKDAPELTYSLLSDIGTSGVVDVRITAADNNSVTLITDGTTDKTVSGTDTTATFTYTQNGTYTFTARDVAGNEKSVSVVVANIDTLAPSINVLEIADTAPQNRFVTICAEVSEQYSSGYDSASYGTDIFYSWNGGEFTKNATYTVTANGTYTLTVKDLLGNEATASVTVSNFDNISPVITQTVYSPDGPVRTQVWVDIFAQDEYPDGYTGAVGLEYSKDGITYQNDNYFTYSENGVYTVYVRDKAGNVSQCTHEVTTIDRTPPALTVSMSPDKATRGEVTLTVTATDAAGIGRIESVFGNKYGTLSMKTLSMDVTVTENGSYTFTSSDQAGNEAVVTYTVSNIDTENPIITALSADNTSPTNGSVTLTVSAEDAFSTGYDESAFGSSLFYRFDENAYGTGTSYTVTENGTYTAWVKDLVGNESSQNIVVGNIDTIAPTIAGLVPDITEPTTENIVITVSASDTQSDGYAGVVERTYSADGVTYTGNNTFDVTENGTYTYYVKDVAGNVTSESITISNIDREAPVVTHTLSTSGATPFVEIKIHVSDISGVAKIVSETDTVQGETSDTVLMYTLTANENKVYTFTVTDHAGNSTDHDVTINNIDIEEPVIDEVRVSNGTPAKEVTVEVVATDFQTVGFDSQLGSALSYKLNDGGYQSEPAFRVKENGTYTLYVKDSAGNVVTHTFDVTCIDSTPPSLSVTMEPDRWTNKPVVIKASATDTVSDGFSGNADLRCEFSFDGVTYSGTNSWTVQRNGTYTVYCRDSVGNVSTCKVNVTQIKMEPIPSDTISVSPSTDGWSKDEIVVTIEVKDSSLAKENAYSFDGGNTWQNDNSFVIKENGTYTFCVRDVAGNVTKISYTMEQIDKELPQAQVRMEGAYESANITLTVDAQDSVSGLADEAYSFDGGNTWQSDNTFIKNGEGWYIILVRDKAGNEHTLEVVLTSDMFVVPTAALTRKATATPSPTETPIPTPTPEPVSEVLPTVTAPTPVIMPSIVPDILEQSTTPSVVEETQTITVEIEDQLSPKADRFNIFRIFTDYENMTPTERAVAISAYGVFISLLVVVGVMMLLLRMRNITVYYHDGIGTFVKCKKASLKQREGMHVVTLNDKSTERSVYRFVPRTRYLDKHRWEPVLIMLNGKEYKRILEPDMTVDTSKG